LPVQDNTATRFAQRFLLYTETYDNSSEVPRDSTLKSSWVTHPSGT
jgi:hypothetical protein